MVKALTLIIFCALFSPIFILAQEKVYLEVKPRSGTMDDNFLFSIVVEDGRDVTAPLLSGGNDFKLSLIGPRNEVSIVNGVVSSKLSYAYRLIPTQEGVFETPSVEIESSGKKWVLPPLKVKIGPASIPKDQTSDEVFLAQTADKTSVFLGEQLINSIELFAKVRFIEPQLESLNYDDFWNQPVGEHENYSRVIDGERYQVLRIKHALYPLREGELILPSRKISGKVLVHRQRRPFLKSLDPFADDFFENFFNTSTYEDKTVKSSQLPIAIKPLPLPPDNFPSWNMPLVLVGDTALTISLSKDPIKVGESKTITLEVSSFGNLHPLKEIPLKIEGHVKQYPENPETKIEEKDGRLLVKKIFRLSLVPLSGGTLTVLPLKLGYFDPSQGFYKYAETEEIKLEVIGPKVKSYTENLNLFTNDKPTNPTPTLTPASNPANEDQTLRYQEETKWEHVISYVSPALILLLLTGLLIIIGGLFLFLRLWKLVRLKGKLFSAIQESQNLDELEIALIRYLAFRLFKTISFPSSSLNRQILLDDLIKPDHRLAFQLIFDELDSARYSGTNYSQEDLSDLRQKVLQFAKCL